MNPNDFIIKQSNFNLKLFYIVHINGGLFIGKNGIKYDNSRGFGITPRDNPEYYFNGPIPLTNQI